MREKIIYICGFLASCMCIFCSCNNSDEIDIKYIGAKLVDSDMWSIVDINTGEVILKDEFKSQPSNIVNDVFFVKNDVGTYDFFNVSDVKKPINKEPFLSVTAFNNNGIAIAVKKGSPILLINSKCEVVKELPKNINKLSNFHNGLASYKDTDGKRGYINEQGDIVIEAKYKEADSFSKDGIAIVEIEIKDTVTKYSAIDKTGKELFSFSSTQYSEYGFFNEGYLPVLKNGEVLLLDKSGKKGITLGKSTELDYIGYYGFVDGISKFYDGASFGLKDNKGNILIRAKYDDIWPINHNKFIVTKQAKFGLIDKDDKVIIPFDRKILIQIKDNIFVVGDDKTVSFINEKGEDIGSNNFINLSFYSGPGEIESNYFDIDSHARKFISFITDSSCDKANKTSKLSDFKHLVSGNKYADMDKSYVTKIDGDYSFNYVFNSNLHQLFVEYYPGYIYPNDAEYNWNATLAGVIISVDVKKYDTKSELALTKAIESKLKSKGFNHSSNNTYKSSKGTSITIGYSNGSVNLLYLFIADAIKVPTRTERKTEKENNESEIDNINIFGLDNSKEDSVVLVDNN